VEYTKLVTTAVEFRRHDAVAALLFGHDIRQDERPGLSDRPGHVIEPPLISGAGNGVRARVTDPFRLADGFAG